MNLSIIRKNHAASPEIGQSRLASLREGATAWELT